MASSVRGPVVVIVGGAILAAALAAFFLVYWGPRKAKVTARVEVESLIPRWNAVRTCLLGPNPMSSDVGEALRARELVDESIEADLDECQPLIKDAGRENEFRTEDDDLEAAWAAYRKQRANLASAVALRTAKRKPHPPRELRDKLAKAASACEAAYQALRAKVSLDPEERAGPRLPTGKRSALLEATPKKALIDFELENNRFVATLNSGSDKKVRTFIDDSGQAQTTPLAKDLLVAADPNPGWGALHDGEEISVLDPGSGKPAAVVGKLRGRLVGAIGGAGGSRTIVGITTEREHVVSFHSPAEGAPYVVDRHALRAEEGLADATLNLPFRRVLVQSAGQSLEWTSDAVAPIPVDSFGPACLAPRASWWLSDGRLVRSVRAGATPVLASEEMPWKLTSCSNAQLLAAAPQPWLGRLALRLCSQSSCPVSGSVPLPGAASAFVLVAPKRGPLVATSAGGVVMVWTSDDAGKGLKPNHAVAIGKARLLGIVEWNGELRLLLDTGKQLELAAID